LPAPTFDDFGDVWYTGSLHIFRVKKTDFVGFEEQNPPKTVLLA
jgi:hypothetical protein